VTDANGCQGTKLVTISQPASALAASAVATNAACFGGNGSVLVSASGGTAPYSGTGTISKAAGSYSFTVTDAHGCSASANATVSQPTQRVVSALAPAAGSFGAYGSGR